MIVAYTEMPPQAGAWPRPLLDVGMAGTDDALVPCLVDSGAQNTLLPLWVARAAGIALDGVRRQRLGVAGTRTEAAFTTTPLAGGGSTWEAEVGFCDPWPDGWGLLGQRSFFRYFTVTFRAVDFELELAPLTAGPPTA